MNISDVTNYVIYTLILITTQKLFSLGNKMRFLHVADIHLGNYQYNNKQRFNDFFLAFKQVAELAVTQQIQVCIIAGDLFHKAAVDALTLLQAEDCLEIMREAGIKILAVAGNHDR